MPISDGWWLAVIPIFIIGNKLRQHLREKRRQIADEEEARYRNKRAARQNDPYGPSRHFAALIDAIEDEARAQRAEEQREDWGKVIREWLAILVIFATFGAIVLQVREMIRVYQPIADQADAARASADAAKRTAEAAVKQAESSERSLVQAERAWLGPLDVKTTTEPEAGKPFQINIVYSNTGRSPATEFTFGFKPIAYDDASPPDIAQTNTAVDGFIHTCVTATRNTNGNVAYPTSGFASYNVYYNVDQPTIDEAATKKKVIVLVGCFVYTTFDAVRHSTFCYFFKPGSTKPDHWNICPGGAYAD